MAAACGGGAQEVKTAAKKAAETTTTTQAPPLAPLTGLPDPSGVTRTRPSLSVKIDNRSEARPQAGLERADIVWDEVVEGGITRFLAMYQSETTDVVGPIRSVRLTDPLVLWPVGGVFAYSGGARYALSALEQAPVTLVTEDDAGTAMFRDRSRRAPFNLFGRPDELFAKGGQPVPPPALFSYRAPGVPASGEGAASVTIGFNAGFAPTYAWDAGSGTWLRSQDGRPFLARSGQQIAPQNVVVLSVAYDGGVGTMGAEAELVGQGNATVFTDGKVIRGTWIRSDRAVAAELRDATGAPILLTPGKTWVELPDVSYRIEVVSPPPVATSTTKKR